MEKSGDQGDGNRITMLASSANPAKFVRQIAKRGVKKLDLVDVVAGGDGFSGRRKSGINPVGKVSNPNEPWRLNGDYRYHRIAGMPFVDGIFIPDGSKGPVQTDSAGHAFAEFPRTDNCTVARPIWAGGGIPAEKGSPNTIKWPVTVKLAGVDYSKPGHGLLLLIPNQGISFDLDAIRRANPTRSISAFSRHNSRPGLGSAGKSVGGFLGARRWRASQAFSADQLVQRRDPLVVPIDPKDRFLTLATTDGGDGIDGDFAIFGDPRLEMDENR